MEKRLKLYVWQNVLVDYTPGIMFALAETPKEARRLIIEKSDCSETVRQELTKKPEVYKNKIAFYLFGGG